MRTQIAHTKEELLDAARYEYGFQFAGLWDEPKNKSYDAFCQQWKEHMNPEIVPTHMQWLLAILVWEYYA